MSHHITTRCPSCRTKYTVGAVAAGKKAKCTKCGSRFRIPRPTLSLEDQILEWLSEPDEDRDRTERVAPRPLRSVPRVSQPRIDRGSSESPGDRTKPGFPDGQSKPKLSDNGLRGIKPNLAPPPQQIPKKAAG